MPQSPRSLFAAVCLAVASLTSACAQAGAEREITGAELYRGCIACHGVDGAGDLVQGAPGIGGLPEWYVALQLERFQTGLRGKHPDDVQGLRMRPMALQLRTERERQAVAAHIASLPRARKAATIAGADVAAGQQAYVMCIACHGANGEGNQTVNAPALAGLEDWYVALQIRKFKSGIRGSVAGDTVGPVMTAMSMAIPPESVDNLAAYISTLPQPAP